ncbi:hypothetical protein BC834DRAFT_327207 [Gloeopeniophorella convolvens]|nr:hypothetical protein BC834DRAFT_327207 [Gloeopeniophorella convolvens]
MVADCTAASFQANQDISGIGIRISLYCTLLITVLMPECRYTSELVENLDFTLAFYALCLVITAVVQTAQGQLDILHASLIMHILAPLVTAYLKSLQRFILVKPEERSFRMHATLTAQVTSTVIIACWASYVRARGIRFGPHSVCNTAPFDTVSYTFNDILTTSFLTLGGSLLWFSAAISMVLCRGPWRHTRQSENFEQSGVEEREPFALSWTLFHRTIVILTVCFEIAMLELKISMCQLYFQQGEDSWTFGQIIALVLLSVTLTDALDALRVWYAGRHGSRVSLVSRSSAPRIPWNGRHAQEELHAVLRLPSPPEHPEPQQPAVRPGYPPSLPAPAAT